MGLFGKKSTSATVAHQHPAVMALVVKADAPPQGAPSKGEYSQGTLRIQVDTPAGTKRQLNGSFAFGDDRWVAPGMTVPVFLDPAQPDAFEVDWSAVPSMQQQAESNDAALADPFVTSRRIAEAIEITPSQKTVAQYERFQKAVEEAAAKPAPAGQLRAVAMIATIRGRFSSSGGGEDGGPTRTGVTLNDNSAAVLSVVVPGKAPYAVYLPKFKIPTKHLTVPGEAIPALVAVANPKDVTILWEETQAFGDIIAARITDSMRANEQLANSMKEQLEAATARASSTAPGETASMGMGTGMPPAARQMLVDNLKRSLQNVSDPANRQLIIDQYHTMGIDVTAEELGF